MENIYFIPFKSLVNVIEYSMIHSYQQRKNDNSGNAKKSYVLDLNNDLFKKIF